MNNTSITDRGDGGIATTLARRDYSVDLLKSIAILGVVIIHTCTYNYAVSSFDFFSSVFWGSISRASVPVFFMCSGALFLSPQKPFSSEKLFTKSIPRILATMLAWGMAYKVFHLLADRELSLFTLFNAFKELLVFKQEFHFYYLQVILLVYLFLPLTRLVTEHAAKKQLWYILILWFLFGIVYPTVEVFWPFTLLDMMAPQYQINMTYAAIGYGVLGFYLKQYPFKRIAGIRMAFSGFLFTFGGTLWMSLRTGSLYTLFLQGMTVGVALMAAGVFILCNSISHYLAGRTVTYLSKASFCIFLTHVFFNYIFPKLGFSVALFPPIIGIPLVAAITIGCSICVYAVLSHIPFISKWLI